MGESLRKAEERQNVMSAFWGGLIKDRSVQVISLLRRRQAAPFPAWRGCGDKDVGTGEFSRIYKVTSSGCSLILFLGGFFSPRILWVEGPGFKS